MAKKKENTKVDFNKEIIIKTSLKKILIDRLILSIFITIALYICLAYYNEEVVLLFNAAAKTHSAMSMALYILPVIIIVNFTITMGFYLIYEDKESNEKK